MPDLEIRTSWALKPCSLAYDPRSFHGYPWDWAFAAVYCRNEFLRCIQSKLRRFCDTVYNVSTLLPRFSLLLRILLSTLNATIVMTERTESLPNKQLAQNEPSSPVLSDFYRMTPTNTARPKTLMEWRSIRGDHKDGWWYSHVFFDQGLEPILASKGYMLWPELDCEEPWGRRKADGFAYRTIYNKDDIVYWGCQVNSTISFVELYWPKSV